MTAPTYTQQQSPQLFGQTQGYDPFNQHQQNWFSGQQFGQQYGQQYGQQGGGDPQTLVWQLLIHAQQAITLAQQIVMQNAQQTGYPTMGQNPSQQRQGWGLDPRLFQRQPMAW
ncbi:MAG TPA: hypothetical protein VF062_07225 [Candidatus Limnocylindrales bacterium]